MFDDLKDEYEMLLVVIIYSKKRPIKVKGGSRPQLGLVMVEGERGNRKRQRGKKEK